MIKTQTKILGLLLFVLLVVGIIYLSLINNEDTHEEKIKVIQIIGCDLISKENYLKFAKLENEAIYQNINSTIIRDRFIKHPYIKTVTVQFTDKNVLTVKITEKNIKCLVDGDTILKAITDNFEFIPFLKETRFNNWIRLTNFEEAQTKIFNINKSENIVKIFKIFDIIQNIDPELLSKIAKIEKGNNKNIVFYCAGNNLINSTYEELEKSTFILSKMYSKYLKNTKDVYVDMNYKGFVYLKNKALSDSVNNKGI